VTPPGGPTPPRIALLNLGQPIAHASDPGWRGNGMLWTQFQSPLSTHRDRASGLLVTKMGWFRARPGWVTITARPVAGPPSRFQEEVGTVASYGPTGFVPSVLAFGRAGCWQLHAKLEDHVLRVVLAISRP
jgi:hypothetical protein